MQRFLSRFRYFNHPSPLRCVFLYRCWECAWALMGWCKEKMEFEGLFPVFGMVRSGDVGGLSAVLDSGFGINTQVRSFFSSAEPRRPFVSARKSA